MRNDRKKKIMTLSILVAAVLLVSVGFAAFSATLKISSGMMVNPDESDFKVVFSSNENTLETNPIKANPSNFGDDATINNATMPTISGLNTYFTNPGDSVTYTFFVRNEGEYEAFLNSISFGGKTCTPEEGTNESMVNSACSAITTQVSVGNITTTKTLTDITGETLIPGQSKQVTVTISYDSNGARANGPFTVEYGDITVYYNVLSGINKDPSEILYTGEIYRNSTEGLSIGGDISTIVYETVPQNISQNYYLKHEVVNNKVTASYACITYTENEVRKDACIRGGGSSYLDSNISILESIASYFMTLPNGSCVLDKRDPYCSSDSLYLCPDPQGDAHASPKNGSSYCFVDSNGYSSCHE